MKNEFWIDSQACKNDYAIATYLIETPLEPEDAVIKLAKEQSLSNWSGDPSSEKEMIKNYAAKGVVNSIQLIDVVSTPSFLTYLPLCNNKYYQFIVKVAYPVCNFGGMLATMYNTVIGEIHNIGVLTGIKVLNIDFPPSYLDVFKGPTFGVEGIRKILQEPESPIFVGPVKPCVGLMPSQFAKTGYEVLKGGFHIIKDDELIVETSYSPFESRVGETVKWVRKAELETGNKKMYFAHIGGDSDKIERFYDIAINTGVDGIMISPAINGLDIAKKFGGQVPILAHNALLYASSRHPLFGVKFSLWEKLQRIAGADGVLNPAKLGTFDIMTEKEQKENIDACLGQLHTYKPIFPAFSGGQCPASLESHYKKLRISDLMIVAGAAAYGHPMGGEAGARSFIQAWDAIRKEIPLNDYANTHVELKISLDAFPLLIEKENDI